MNRRDLLRGVAAAGAVGTLAGCVSEDDPGESADGADSDPDNSNSNANGGSGARASPSVVGGEIVEEKGECAGDADGSRGTAAVAFGDTGVTVTGGVGTPNPCYEASLAEQSYDADADELTVIVAATAEDAICQQCLGVLGYEAAVEFDDGLPGAVTVRHERDDETTTITTAER